MPTPTIPNGAAYMAATLYTGNGGTLSVTNSGSFQPDFVWMKSRSNNYSNTLYDSVRGTGTATALYSDTTNAEGADTTLQNLTSFNANGFSLGTTSGTNIINTNGASLVAWQWKAGGTSVSNTSGTITSSVSANTTSGFSVVIYTGTGANATVGHGLGVAPSMIIIKQRSTASVNGNWAVYHQSLGNTGYLALNTTSAVSNDIGYWNNTSPTSNVFSVGTFEVTNRSTATYVAYCWAPIAGYSAFGSYTGNGSTDGPFIYTGFRPAFIMIKSSSTGGAGYDWFIQDTSRNPTNDGTLNHLWADSSLAENNGTISTAANNVIDVLSNGFKCRYAGGATNGSGVTMIYMAFAANPFKYSNAF